MFSRLLAELEKINPEFVILFNRWSFRFFPVSSQISQLNFDNEEEELNILKTTENILFIMELTLLRMVSQKKYSKQFFKLLF